LGFGADRVLQTWKPGRPMGSTIGNS